ncbi:hypothetical protein D3C76_1255650 [compost metagenome]
MDCFVRRILRSVFLFMYSFPQHFFRSLSDKVLWVVYYTSKLKILNIEHDVNLHYNEHQINKQHDVHYLSND